MSPQERIDLLDEIWFSFRTAPETLPLSDAQREELDRRLDELEKDEITGIPWQNVLDRIRGRAG